MFPRDARRKSAAADGADQLGATSSRRHAATEVARDREPECDGRIEVRARDVTDGVDHGHDHEPEAERDPDLAELARSRVDHDRAAAGEHEREDADRLGDERPGERHVKVIAFVSRARRSAAHAYVDLVPDSAHGLEVLAGRVLDRPSPRIASRGRSGTRRRSPS